MTLKLMVEKLSINKKKFITSDEIKDYCKNISEATGKKTDYLMTVKYLIRHKYLARIFRGLFYVYSIEERKLGKEDLLFYDIIKEALKIKRIKSWYFGLETALKMNNLTHEYFAVYYVINDKIFRAKTIKIMGRKVKFYKLKREMFFGINVRGYSYSDPEKTILDLFYLKHYSSEEFKEVAEKLSRKKIIKYVKKYDNRTKRLVKEL